MWTGYGSLNYLGALCNLDLDVMEEECFVSFISHFYKKSKLYIPFLWHSVVSCLIWPQITCSPMLHNTPVGLLISTLTKTRHAIYYPMCYLLLSLNFIEEWISYFVILLKSAVLYLCIYWQHILQVENVRSLSREYKQLYWARI